MKNHKLIVFALVGLVSFHADILNAQTATEEKVAWDYPVKPGTMEWATFKTGQQKLEACQIPQKTLETLSTKDLARVCLNYPLFFEFALVDDERVGISIIIENFNGLKELSKSKDGVVELINIYKNIPVLADNQQVTINDDILLKLPFLELLLSDDAFIHQMDDQMLVELEKIVLAKYDAKLQNMYVYSLYNIKKTFLLGAVVMNQRRKFTDSSQQQQTLKRFIENYRYAEPALLTEISKIISEI